MPARATVLDGSLILVVADGLGINALTYGLLKGWLADGPSLPNLERYLKASRIAFMTTYSSSSWVTDSAASATAMACGVKTKNGYVGMDAQGKPCMGVVEAAQAKGKVLGFVTNEDITDATPAAFSAHALKRDDSKAITRDQKRLAPRLLIGKDTVLPEFAGRKGEDIALSDLARYALRTLSAGSSGFFLLLETEKTDEAGHVNDTKALLAALKELDDALAVVLDFQSEHPQVSVALACDHDTGGPNILEEKGGGVSVAWATRWHTAAPAYFAVIGPAATQLPGLIDNTDVAGFIRDALSGSSH